MTTAAAAPVPPLREDLVLLRGPAAPDGSPTWTIYDAARDRYFRIGWQAMEMLARWGLGASDAIAAAVRRETTAPATVADVEGLARFLRVNDLAAAAGAGAIERLVQRLRARETGWLKKAVHGYLFFRIPLVRPDRFLAATLPLVAPFYSTAWRVIVLLAALAGLFLISRQWDAFVDGIEALASWDSAALLAVTLAAVKILHELGHGYTARRYGCRVPTMGVAFMVMWPVLYTDTTHAYRLTARRERLAIAAGGIMVELTLAAFATLAWALLPDGGLRAALHTLATISWIGTVAINLNPLMRFDGYYILADALGIANLQDRSFALARWRLRRLLFGLDDPPPEAMPAALRRWLIAYAVTVWIYRFFLFLGIALLVYEATFKLLGIVLMGIEIVFFVALPILRELRVWWRRRREARLNPNMVATLLALGGLATAGLLPWSWPVAAPAVLQPAESVAVHAPSAARVAAIRVRPGDLVGPGDVLFELRSPELDFDGARAAQRAQALAELILREAAVQENADRVSVLREELAAAQTQGRSIAALQDELILRAPIAGRVTDLADPLDEGHWARPENPLARIVSAGATRVVAYVAGEDMARLSVAAPARFIAEDPAAPAVRLRVAEIETAGTTTLDQPYLASTLGGPVLVTEATAGARRLRKPVAALYRVTLVPEQGGPAERTVRGRVWIDGPPVSLVDRAWRTAWAVLVRESGF